MWIGWMLIGSMMLLFVLTLIFHDMVPLMFYLVTLISGVALVELVNRTVLEHPGSLPHGPGEWTPPLVNSARASAAAD